MLYAVLATGMARIRGAQAIAPPPKPVENRASALASIADLSPEEEASRQMIASEANRQKGCRTLYDVLGVDSKVDPATAKNAYLRLARQFHADVFAGQQLGELATVLDEIFKKIREANDVISDPAKGMSTTPTWTARPGGFPRTSERSSRRRVRSAGPSPSRRRGGCAKPKSSTAMPSLSMEQNRTFS